MVEHEPLPVRARGTRQRETGAASRRETRRLLLLAAGELFAERGYAAATVTSIADRAQVSLQTLYLAWGSKRALLRAFMESSLRDCPEGVIDAQWVAQVSAGIDAQVGPAGDGRVRLQGLAHQYRLICERAALGWKLYRDAAAVDSEIEADWTALQSLRRGTFAGLIGQLPAEALRPGLTPEAAADTAWAIASPETYDLLVRHASWSLDAYEQWVGTTLISALLAEA